MRFVFSFLLLFMFALGCGGNFGRQGEEKGSGAARWPSNAYPLDMPEDLAIVPKEYPLDHGKDSARVPESFRAHQRYYKDSTIGPSEVYRIQIYNSNTYGPALRELGVAKEVFDGNTWLDYEVPYYKVRLGNFLTREEAEQYLPTVREAGYPEAWVVRVNTNIQTLDEPVSQPIPVDSSGTMEKLIRHDGNSADNPGN